MTRKTMAIALIGSGGSGVMTAGDLLLRAAAKAGWRGLMTRSAGPQIRGGEAAAYVVLSTEDVTGQPDRFDLLFAVDWKNAERFSAEIPMDANSLVVSGDPASASTPAIIESGAKRIDLDLKEMLKPITGGRANMVAVGVVAELAGIPDDGLVEILKDRLGSKGEAALAASLEACRAGREAVAGNTDLEPLAPPASGGPERWVISGNQAAGLGAVRGGVRFVAAYPITPATEILEWLSPRLKKVGGLLVQAEDELASINMAIGGAYGGVPALTATSGPGLALMMESVGLAVTSEIPVVVIDVMRGGPSTGIPTKSEQSDLNIAVYGLPGDAPHVVVAANSIGDCVFTTQWAVHLAETLQTAVIMLSDQAMGQATAAIDRPADISFYTARSTAKVSAEAGYHRYALTADGVSPMAIPGTVGGQYTADGLEHTERGVPSSTAEDHLAQLEKRRRKIEDFDYGDAWASIDGDGDVAIVTFGSMSGPVLEAARRLDPAGERIRVVTMRLIAPARPDDLAAALDGVDRVLVVEQSHGAQFHHYLKAHFGLGDEADVFHRPGPLPIRPSEIEAKLKEWVQP